MPSHCRMRLVDRDLIRGGHYGQQSCEPHQKAEHMAAPTNAAKCEESSCQPGAAHTCGGFRLPGCRSIHVLRGPAAEKRQGTKSREVGHRWCNGRYGDLMAAPISMLDVTPTGRGRGICTQAGLEAWNRHLGKRSERINERTVRRAL